MSKVRSTLTIHSTVFGIVAGGLVLIGTCSLPGRAAEPLKEVAVDNDWHLACPGGVKAKNLAGCIAEAYAESSADKAQWVRVFFTFPDVGHYPVFDVALPPKTVKDGGLIIGGDDVQISNTVINECGQQACTAQFKVDGTLLGRLTDQTINIEYQISNDEGIRVGIDTTGLNAFIQEAGLRMDSAAILGMVSADPRAVSDPLAKIDMLARAGKLPSSRAPDNASNWMGGGVVEFRQAQSSIQFSKKGQQPSLVRDCSGELAVRPVVVDDSGAVLNKSDFVDWVKNTRSCTKDADIYVQSFATPTDGSNSGSFREEVSQTKAAAEILEAISSVSGKKIVVTPSSSGEYVSHP